MCLAVAVAAACGQSDATCPSAAPVAAAAPAATDDGGVEQPDLAGDFELLDPSTNTFQSLDGVIPTLSDLAIPITRRTMRYVEQFAASTKGRKTFLERFHRATKYKEMFEHKLRDRDLPEDLVWVAAIESGFNPQAISKAGAVGLFQFMPETAERFELGIAEGLDERRSIVKSIDAAIAYLSLLKDQFGSWDLALAAYNCGEGCVTSAIAHARDRLARPVDQEVQFYELAQLELVPRETAHYVPMIHAFAIVVHNRELLDLEDYDPMPPMRFAELAVPAGTRLATISKAADISLDTLQEYNPDLLSDRVPDGNSDRLVQIPADTLEQALAALPALLARDQETLAPPRKAVFVDDPQPEPPKPKAKKRKALRGKSGDIVMKAAPGKPGLYILGNGILIDIKEAAGEDVEVHAEVELLDPTKNRKPFGPTFRTETKKARAVDVDQPLAATGRELGKLLYGEAGKKLRELTARRRRDLYAHAAGSTKLFTTLSDHLFPESNPLHGRLIAGLTARADDLFIEPEPTWALSTVVTIEGPVVPEDVAEAIGTSFANVLVPPKQPSLAGAGRLTTSNRGREIVVAWSSPALTRENETASYLAVLLACHPKLGRAHVALRRGVSIAANVRCAVELTPQSTVAWIYAMPIEPFTVDDAERSMEGSLDRLVESGPTDTELQTARGLLRTELAREREMATIRGLPKSRVIATNERILEKLDDVDAAAVTGAAKQIFANDHRVVVSGG